MLAGTLEHTQEDFGEAEVSLIEIIFSWAKVGQYRGTKEIQFTVFPFTRDGIMACKCSYPIELDYGAFFMPTPLKLTPEQVARYRASAENRRRREQTEIAHRRKLAWKSAKQAAQLLKTKFYATRVVAFGSLVREAGFTCWSDVDIAAWGIAPEDTFQAIGTVMEMETDVPENLVDVNTARPSLLTAIDRDGIEL